MDRVSLNVVVVVVAAFVAAGGHAEQVECKATAAVVCAHLANGCQPDRTYAVKFNVDREAGTVVDADGTIYEIVPTESAAPLFEYAIQATAKVGSAAVETIVLGEQSFVSSNVSVAPPRAYVQAGACHGLKAP